MKIKTAMALGVASWGCMAVTSCGGSSDSVQSSAVESKMLDSTQVLALATVSSDTDDALDTNDGAVTVVPTDDETSDPVDINAT